MARYTATSNPAASTSRPGSYGPSIGGSSSSPSPTTARERAEAESAVNPTAFNQQQAAAAEREAVFQQQQAAARQPTGQQTAEQMAASQQAAGIGGQLGTVAGGFLGGSIGGPLGAVVGKGLGSKLGSALGGQTGGVIGPDPVMGGGYDVPGAQTFQTGVPSEMASAGQFGTVRPGSVYGTGPGAGAPGGQFSGTGWGQLAATPTAAAPGVQLGGGIGGAVGAEVAGQQAGIEEQRRMLAQTQAGLSPYQQAGASALQQQQALTGLLGQEAQQAAYDAINVSPGQRFLRDRQEKALLRNAAATGGLGGGNVLTGLQQQAMGFAQQDVANQFGRLGGLSGQGLQAVGAGGEFGSATAANIANLLGASGEARASGILGQQALEAQKAEGVANLVGMFAEPIADVAGDIWTGVTESWGW